MTALAALEAEGIARDDFHDRDACRRIAQERGLEPIAMAAASNQDWDRYEFLQTAAVDRFSRQNPTDPDIAGIRARRARSDESYLRWGRDHCGFARWAFRKA